LEGCFAKIGFLSQARFGGGGARDFAIGRDLPTAQRQANRDHTLAYEISRLCKKPAGLYQRAKMLTHHVLEMLKPRTGLTNA
jgi:hypothetical protein